jgi:hypothetical protein
VSDPTAWREWLDWEVVVKRPRAAVSLVLLVVDLCALVLSVGNVHGPVRFVAGLILGLAVPGWSIVGFLRLASPGMEVALSVATSLALLLVAAQVLISVHEWHLVAFEDVVCLVCGAALYVQVRMATTRGGAR